MNDPLTVALVGIGGFGNHYVSALLDAPDQDSVRLLGAIDPLPQACGRLAELESRKVPIYPSLQAFHDVTAADLVVISSPLHLHAEQTIAALQQKSHVLCEKPLCAIPAQAKLMLQARDSAQRQVAIGYQWSFSNAIQQLKADVLSGEFGRPRRFRSLVLWPRDQAYYRRNRWAGAQTDPSGAWILDSPVNNACAHYLHNMLYLLGNRVDRSAVPARVQAELYRANPIQNYDTAVLRCITDDQVELLFVTSHATGSLRGPVFRFEFERATVDFSVDTGSTIVAHFADGREKDYSTPNEPRDRKLWLTIEAIRRGRPTVCGIEAASAHTQVVFAAQHSAPICPFPDSLVSELQSDGHRRIVVQALDAALERCYAQWRLPSELALPWASPAREVQIQPI
jgi:predicted dehydrogenase